MRVIALAFVLAVASADFASYRRASKYHGQKVLTCRLEDTTETGHLDQLVDEFDLDIWGSSAPGTVDIRAKDAMAQKGLMAHFNGSCHVAVDDVEATVQQWEKTWELQTANQTLATGRHLLQDPNWFTNYRSYADITNWYRTFATANPTLVRYIPSIGRSSQGRDMPAVVITGATGSVPRIYMQCLIHAREWISGATCNWLINQLVEDYKAGDATARTIMNGAEIHLVPFTNPDGYEWTRSNDRLWRKSRNVNAGSTCIGTDLNRNYNDNWGRGGSSTNPCSDTYMGRAAADAPETQVTSNYFRTLAPVIGAIDWHAYSQLILRPYGWSSANSPDETRLRAIGQSMADAIRADSGRSYRNIKSIELYVTTGTTSDWFYGADATRTNGGYRAAGYTMELRPTGANPGFQLPPAEIIPSGRENYQAFKAFATDLIRNPIRA